MEINKTELESNKNNDIENTPAPVVEEYSLATLNSSLEESAKDIAKKVVNTNDSKEFKDYIQLFNLNQSKKNALKVMKLNGLLDKIEDQAIERFDKNPDEMSNEDLIKFMQVIQSSIDRSQKVIDKVEEKPLITINSQTNNITIEGDNPLNNINRESRERILEVMANILSQVQMDDSAIDNEEKVIDTIDIEPQPILKEEGEEQHD